MTLPLSSSSPAAFDLATINAVQAEVVRKIRQQVCQWEQDALDASHRSDYRAAQQYREWAFAADIAASKASGACTDFFIHALNALPLIQDERTVELPRFHRCVQDRRLDDLATEVASQQPCPDSSRA